MKLMDSVRLPQVSLRWLTCACFEIRTPDGFSIVIDPYISAAKATELTAGDIQGADLILVSHTHYDHVTDVKTLMDKFDSRVLVGDQSAFAFARWLNCNPTQLYPMAPGMELDFGPARVKALFARHSDPHQPLLARLTQICALPAVDEAMAETQWFGTLEYRNYLITLASGLKILFWGSCDTVEERNPRKKPRQGIKTHGPKRRSRDHQL